VNVDLCFVPVSHQTAAKLPAVSGSSGRLVVTATGRGNPVKPWPGQVFEDRERSYTEAMLAFVQASAGRQPLPAPSQVVQLPDKQASKTDIRLAIARLRRQRQRVQAQRQQEDAAWKLLKQEHRRRLQAPRSLLPHWGEKKRQKRAWQTARQQRQETRLARQAEDERWRQKLAALQQRLTAVPPVTAWIAILVITDNCTRQCLGLPLFVAGPKLTADLVVQALRHLLPPELRFLISDRGTHFTANVFQQLAQDQPFIHVLIARHRPQSNGIAERFVRTLKEWLADHSWSDEAVLALLLAQFLAHYNDRPHQGLPIPGLSPNEFANRLWLM
jgi:transposase InsO family protein